MFPGDAPHHTLSYFESALRIFRAAPAAAARAFRCEGRASQFHNLLGREPQDPRELADEHGATCPYVRHK